MSEDLKDALLAIAAIAVPVLSAILDRNRKKRKTPQVHSRPVTDHEIEELRRTFDIEDDEEDIHEVPVPEPVQPPKKENTVFVADIIDNTEETGEKKLTELSPEDKKKLIIYSEIMRPKFDD